MNNYKLIMLLFLGLFLLSLVNSEIDSLTQIKGQCITLRQEYVNSTYTNISSITYPNTTTISLNKNMTRTSLGVYTYNFCLTDKIGEYSYCTITDVDGIQTTVCTPFDITESGRGVITNGESNILIIALIVMLSIVIFLSFLGFKIENWAVKTVLLGTVSVLLLIIALYSMVFVGQILGGFGDIVEGYSTFWFVIQILFGLALTGLVIFGLYISYKIWMVKRGFRD